MKFGVNRLAMMAPPPVGIAYEGVGAHTATPTVSVQGGGMTMARTDGLSLRRTARVDRRKTLLRGRARPWRQRGTGRGLVRDAARQR